MKPLSYYHCPGLFWIRIFGKGLGVKDERRHPLMFSERVGAIKFLRLGHWIIKWLPADKSFAAYTNPDLGERWKE